MTELITNSSPMQLGSLKTQRIMLLVIAALLPGISVASWFFGWGFLINVLLAAIFAIGLEAFALGIQKKPIKAGLSDNSALVTALLFGISIPPGSSWWLVFLGIAFAILIAKHAYGGLGQNPFNPAMSGYLFLLISFPLDMTSWQIPVNYPDATPLGWEGLQQSLLVVFPFLFSSTESMQATVDGMTMATPLIVSKMAGTNAILEAQQAGLNIFARTAETGWELMNIAYLCGGLALLALGIISWHIPVSIILTLAIVSGLFYSPHSSAVYGTPYLHLFGSATMVGAFFIATDPVSAATTNKSKILYGIIIGLGIYAVRVWGSYLDSIAIAVLFGNFCAPLLDHYCRPRIYGHPKQGLVSWLLGNRS
ncbi:MAG: RnfABCDGE type electron transport complex subunit D [Gammaproteobacteria bacterium]|nr:RnfABCDGE type electron transport complex subunit D [Gammaproteobacteria bacterium]MDD9958212.1 RnfABCDGE type electron transport complex subunit D [Gammaproteobacteria bacterium]